jgi:protein involved in polysaccharide export with SLBB domain
VIGPITTRSEFEMFAEDAAGRRLHVYGRQLFDEAPTTFAPMDHIPVPADYVLGPGDQLLIRVWGKIDLDGGMTVDRDGQIFIPKVGSLRVAGLRYEQLESYLRAAIGNLYKGFELSVTMGKLRSIQIFVLGSARQPGAYTVSSLSTLVNALFASGGPSATGSMRHIQLRRDNRVVADFDIYDLLRRGDKSHDVQLLPGDVIYIPPAGPQVAIIGSVNEPGIYELKGETTIAAALGDAGGLTNLAEVDRVLLEKIENHRRRGVDDFSLDRSGLERKLKDGDMLRIFPISPQFENAVMLRGNVFQPGHFPWHEGMRVSDLIPSRDFLITRSYWYQEGHLTESAPAGSSWSMARMAMRAMQALRTRNMERPATCRTEASLTRKTVCRYMYQSIS